MANGYASEQRKLNLERSRAVSLRRVAERPVEAALKGGKIGNLGAFALVAFGLAVDGVQILLELVPGIGTGINSLITFFAALIVGFSLYLFRGMGIRDLTPLFGGSAVEIIPIPFLSMLPAFTAGIAAILIQDRLGSFAPIIKKLKGK